MRALPRTLAAVAAIALFTPPKGVIGRAPVEVKVTDANDRTTRQVFEVSFD